MSHSGVIKEGPRAAALPIWKSGKIAFFTNAQSRFAIVVLEGVLEPDGTPDGVLVSLQFQWQCMRQVKGL